MPSFNGISSSSSLSNAQGQLELPLLLDLELEDDEDRGRIIPLPSSHLPDELRTLSLFEVRMDRPVPRLVIDHARRADSDQLFGQVVAYSDRSNNARAGAAEGTATLNNDARMSLSESLVGAIGCASEVLLAQSAPAAGEAADLVFSVKGSTPSTRAVCRSAFRFTVKSIVASIPYLTAIVEELVDDDVSIYAGSSSIERENLTVDEVSGKEELSDDHEEDAENEEAEDDPDSQSIHLLSPVELVPRLLFAMKECVDLQVKGQEDLELSPLEVSILQDSEPLLTAQQHRVEEMAAVFDVFQSTLVDVCPLPRDRYYAIAMLAAELASLDDSVRRACLTLTNGVERMRLVLRELQSQVKLMRARVAADQITRTTDDQQRDLQVGEPTLPPWARQIRKGTKVEYFWNEEYGWCLAEVVEEPLFVVDEIIITLYFPEDGTTHRLPFTADDKIRWRPARSGS
jgi:hypothetical protein